MMPFFPYNQPTNKPQPPQPPKEVPEFTMRQSFGNALVNRWKEIRESHNAALDVFTDRERGRLEFLIWRISWRMWMTGVDDEGDE